MRTAVPGSDTARFALIRLPAQRIHVVTDRVTLTIPSSDRAFRAQVDRLIDQAQPATPGELESRLRRLFPRAVVRRRDISGETPAWYVYRDGRWRSDLTGPWWEAPGTPTMELSREGWIVDADATALGLLGIDRAEDEPRHFTDFTAPGALDDTQSMFRIVDAGDALNATVLLRPTTGDVIAIDMHAYRDGDRIKVSFRLADDVELDLPVVAAERPAVRYEPANDAAFRGYAELLLGRMPEPTLDGLMLRLHRLYPHARVEADETGWLARRDGDRSPAAVETWWTEPSLPRVRYDAQALILEANPAAERLLGRSMVGHYWQEFVTAGSTEQVTVMLEILAEVGAAESRFRMPRGDGKLLEFDSYTVADGEHFTTVFRPVSAGPGASAETALPPA